MATERHIYGLRAVERMTGLPVATILEWEDRHGIGKPVTGASGEMLYSRDDVEELLAFRRSRGETTPATPGATDTTTEGDAGAIATPDESPGTPIDGDPTDNPRETPARLLVLLAERDPYAAELTEYFLRTEGYSVTTVFTVEDAQRNLEQADPDLAIVELLLEGGAGFSLVENIGASGKCPVIVLSAIDPGDHPAISDAAVVLPKPIRSLDLVSAVRDLLGTSALVRERKARQTEQPQTERVQR